jgi:outer membrane protein TolC
MKARGGFDPKLEVDYERKDFKDTEYWDRLSATFKVPTYFGIEFKGNYAQNEGVYINPDETVPDDGLYSAGVSMSLGQGFWINERMATLRKAKYFREQTKAEQDILVNRILFEAAVAYFDWLKAYRTKIVYQDFLINADQRFQGVVSRAKIGDVAQIDTVEAKITVQTRQLEWEQAQVSLVHKALRLSYFLWMDGVPIELQAYIKPDIQPDGDIELGLGIADLALDSVRMENHPKLIALNNKIEGLTVDKRLKANKLLPRIDVEYNFLMEEVQGIRNFDSDQYKGGVSFRFPLFLRKERGDLKLAKFKLRDVEFDRDNVQVAIRNKVRGLNNELESYAEQNRLIFAIVANYNTLLQAEERKFEFGESSLFLVNSRENKLIDARLKQIQVQNKFFGTKAKLFKSLALNPEL